MAASLRLPQPAIWLEMWRRPRGPKTDYKTDRSVLRLGVKALTHALLIGVCPNFWPLPAGRGDPLYPGGARWGGPGPLAER